MVLGTGLTALTLARSLLTITPALPIHLTLIDKAKNPGGRLTTRYYDSGVVLETGARVFETPKGEADFAKEVESWESKGWVKEVEQARRKGAMGDGKWWEGVGGLTKGLVEGLLGEVKAAAAGRLSIHYEVTVSYLDAPRQPLADSCAPAGRQSNAGQPHLVPSLPLSHSRRRSRSCHFDHSHRSFSSNEAPAARRGCFRRFH